MTTNAAEIKIKLFREIDSLPEKDLPDLQVLVEKYLSKVKSQPKRVRKLDIMRGLVAYMAPDFNAPMEDFSPYM